MHAVTLRHTFEAGHRLPDLNSKCHSIHGHSWHVAVTITSDTLAPYGTVVEFGEFKRLLRGWIDNHLDHGTMLGTEDPLVPAFNKAGSKVRLFTEPTPWPTVEAVAQLIAERATEMLERVRDDDPTTTAPGAAVTRVVVRETGSNSAEWIAP